MRFRNLKPNGPKTQQYQLWIIDGERNAAQPVDGGVFDQWLIIALPIRS